MADEIDKTDEIPEHLTKVLTDVPAIVPPDPADEATRRQSLHESRGIFEDPWPILEYERALLIQAAEERSEEARLRRAQSQDVDEPVNPS